MKHLLVMALGAAMLLSAGSAVAASPQECSRYRRQIAHYQGMAERAEDLGNEMWTERMQHHVDLLKSLQKERCPEDVPVDTTLLALEQMMKLAAKAAVTYFTFGAF